jgi:hypothetical protein
MAKPLPGIENYIRINLKGINLSDMLPLTPKELEDWLLYEGKDIIIIEDEIRKLNFSKWN